MADEQIVTNIVATSDFSGLIADVQRTTSALTKLQKELALSNKTLSAQAGQIQKAFGDTLRSTGQFTTHFVTVGSEIDRFGKNLDAGKLKLRDYFQTWQTHTKTSGGLIRDLAKQQVALQNAIVQPLGKSADGLMKFNVHVANGLNEITNKSALARKEMQIYNKVIQDGGVQLINWGKNTQWAGRQLTVGLTVPIAAFGAAAQKAFREADQELVRLTKVYGGLTATSAAELAKVRKDVSATAKELSSAYGSSYKDTIALAADIAATGKQGNELLESTKEATRLSILGEVDRQEAMKATLAIQSAFKQNTTELSQSINFLNAVENQTSTSLADLVEAIPKAGPVVKALGGDVQDLALYLTAMREGGINASEGANALKSALASIINPTKVAKEQFMSFGIDLSGIVNQNAGDLTATILGIQAALETLDPLKKSQAIEQLFGKFQFARMNALFENLGKQGSQTLQVLDLMKASSQDLANVAGRELSQITESASGQYRRAVESLKADLAGLGEQFLRISTFFIKTVDGLVKFINNLPGPLKTVVTILAGITALSGPLIMLTGVFANFIGYVVKGIGHIRAIGRGGEGFKLLTPEILAAEQAGSLIEKTFYNDAAAAGILKTALSNLSNELTILQTKAASGSVSVQPTLSTIQGNIIAEGTQRVADPNNPLIGKPYSRQMSHLNPVAGMTNAERAAQTIFGVVPGPGPVNQRIGKNPQIYSEGDLPKIEGVTSIKGVSTGIVAQEAAKWHSMTAALAMQSKEEIASLKREVASTGAVTTELATSYQALLPQMTGITTMAAQEAKLIVAQLEAGKVTVDQARAKIISLNAQVEAMMAQTAAQVATAQGRVLNVSAVPLTGQPVVDPTTGKTNMKEMFHKSKTSALVDKIARSLGVRTSGGGYSTHTTIPKKLNDGGQAWVPGNTSINKDIVPAMLTPGEFVIRQSIAQSDPQGMQMLNNGEGMVVPVQGKNLGGLIARLTPRGRKILSTPEIQRTWRSVFGKHGSAPKPEYEPKGNAGIFGGHAESRNFSASTAKINKDMETIGVDPRILLASINARGGGARTSTDVFLSGLAKSGIISKQEYRRLSKKAFDAYAKRILSMEKVADDNNPVWSVSNDVLSKEFSNNPDALAFWQEYSRQPGGFADAKYRSSSNFLNQLTLNGKTAKFANLESSGSNKFYHTKEEANPFIAKLNSYFGANAGGMVPGYVGGGAIPSLSKAVINRITANWPKPKQFYKPGFQYKLGNQDPLHGPLQIGMSSAMNRYAGYNPKDYGLSRRVNYRDDEFNRITSAEQFLTGTMEERGKYATAQYMSGNLDVMSQMEKLGNHPLGPIAAMKTLQKKFTGKLFRGIKLDKTFKGLPQDLVDAIKTARITGDASSLIGKEFIMRRSSWSKSPTIASFFAPGSKVDPNSLVIEAAIKNRNILPAGDMFPDKKFMAPYGQDWSGGKPGGQYKSEKEAIFGGKFRIVGFEKGRLKVETVVDGARKNGGPVNANRPYLVGENGPEVFVPRNNGGIIPNYNKGGQVASQIGMIGGSIGGSMVGSAIAGPVGGMVGSIAGGFLPQILSMLKSKELASSAQMFSKTNVAIGGTVAALGLLYAAYKRHNEEVRLSTLGYGLSEEAASKAGLKYKDLGATLKDAIKNNQSMAEKNRLVYASLTQAGTPLKLTIEQYRKLKEEVKSTMPDIVKLIDQTNKKDVGELAIRLKTNFMQAGMAADEATKKTYALIEASNKKGMGASAIASQEFRSINDLETAAAFSARSFNKVEASGGSKQSYQALESTINGINLGIDEIISKSKTNISYQDAVAQQFQKINTLSGKQVTLSTATIDQVKKQMPELGNVLNETDNIKTVWQKYQLIVQGTNEDLKSMTSTAVNALYKMNAEIAVATKQSIENTQLKSSIDLVGELTKRQKKLESQAKGASVEQQINSKKQAEALQKQIELIKSEAAARKKALQERQSDENASIAIQKKQLEYQDALAAGDMSRAAQAQLDLQQITKEQQTTIAERAIDKQADAKIAPLQKQLDAINKANDDLANNAARASSALGDLTTKINNMKNATQAYEDLAIQIKQKLANPTSGNEYKQSEQYRADLATLSQLFTEAQKLNPNLKTPEGVKISKGGPVYTTGAGLSVVGATSAADVGQQLIDQIKFSKIQTDTVTILANNIKTEAKGGPVGGGSTTAGPVKEVTSSTLKQAVRDAVSGKIGTKKWNKEGTTDFYNLFEWQGKKYAVDTITGTNLYNFDMQRNQLGARIPKYHKGTGPGGVPAPYGKEMLAIVEGGERIFPKEYSSRFDNASYQGNSYTIQNNINGSDMNTQELADIVTRRTLAAIKTIEYNQMRALGQGRSF